VGILFPFKFVQCIEKMETVVVGYYLRNDKTKKRRVPTSSEMNVLIKDLKDMLKIYASKYSIEKLGVERNGSYLLKVQFKDRGDNLILDFLYEPDDDGNYYIGDYGWQAEKKSFRVPTAKASASPKRCKAGSRRSTVTGLCEKYKL